MNLPLQEDFLSITLAAQTTFTLYTSASQLPENWDTLAKSNIFLSAANLAVLEKAAPKNMQCHFIGIYDSDSLCGIAVAQYINLSAVSALNQGKKGIKDFLFRKFSSHILFIGNNTLTGQNAYIINNSITENEALAVLKNALSEIEGIYKKQGVKISLLAVKDFNDTEIPDYEATGFKGYFKFCTQPNMIFTISQNWASVDDYLAALSTKYRTQYKRARKKAEGIEKRKLTLEEITAKRQRIYELYLTVARNAVFNTFFLPENHFEVMKQELADNFLFYGYFLDGQLIGFSTLIKNNSDMDTYFLGYDEKVQKEKLLYLNMLYDMVAYAIKKGFKHVVFARSAMEIKSSVGAKAEQVYGIIKHTNPLINMFMKPLFNYIEPKTEWKERSPFK